MNPKFFRNGIVMLVLVVGTAALLFTWISTSSTPQATGYSKFLDDVATGHVEKVTQQGSTLTVNGSGPTLYSPHGATLDRRPTHTRRLPS